MCQVVWVGGREGGGAWWLPAGGIRASQDTFSSFYCIKNFLLYLDLKGVKKICSMQKSLS